MIIAWLTARLGVLRWVILGLAMVSSAWATHRIDSLLQTEREKEATAKIVAALPQVITETQTITRIVNASPDACVHATLPADIAAVLHRSN